MRLSKIKYFNIFFKYPSKVLETIVFTKNKYNSQDKFDIAIVFGGVSMIPYRLDEAIKLYKKKKVKKILVTGGIGFLSLDRKNREAYTMKNYLVANGVDEWDIIIEDRSRNTYENIINSAAILKEDYSLDKSKIILITSDFHLKRCMELTKKNTPFKNIYGIGIKDNKNDLENWKSNSKGKRYIRIEAFLVCFYAKNDKIEDLEIDM
ncbi:MAG: YdcF family protein [Bacilli bacterium]|nr:YdcF family protein [Bacilli bacterium]